MFDKILKALGKRNSSVRTEIGVQTVLEISKTREPTEEEWQLAKDNLKKAAKNASLAELGGTKPEKENRHTSWWGGNFLGLNEEKVPVCAESGREMHPVLQIRMDEIPHCPEALEDVALLTLWFDLEGQRLSKSSNGHGFEIRTYDTLENLNPLGPGYREHESFPTFPIKWYGLEGDLPDWESFDGAPEIVRLSDDFNWFDNHPTRDQRAKMQQTMPTKIGGHAQWWQSPKYVEDGKYVFFLDSTIRGQFGFPAGGNGNFFRTPDSWELRVDFT